MTHTPNRAARRGQLPMPKRTPFIIAEAGVNHNGSLDLALQLVAAAHQAGADAVKFQTFNAKRLVNRNAGKAQYQKRTTSARETQQSMLERLELDEAAHRRIVAECRKIGITFLSSPFDEDSVDLLARLGVTTLKVPSGEITNLPYLRRVARTGLPLIVSTGMSTLVEVGRAMDTLRDAGASEIVLLHCVTEYPAPVDEINLRAMLTLRDAFHVPVGYSDHTPGFEVAIAATALGAEVIEKHITLDRNMPGPDHAASHDPAEFAALVTALRNVVSAMGNGIKEPAACERKNMAIARKSLVSSRSIPAGARLTAANVTIKRPGTGIDPSDLEKALGRRTAVRLAGDQVIKWSDLA
jgi:N,N'-diacetyllegionaminate synthase